jgi:hypothetical protein
MTEKPTCGGSPTVFLTSRAESLPLAMISRPSKPADDPISATDLDDRYARSGEGGSSYMPPGAGDDLLGCTRYVAAFRSTKRNYVADAPNHRHRLQIGQGFGEYLADFGTAACWHRRGNR